MIQTYWDCPYRKEDIRTTEQVLASYDYNHGMCPERCPQSPRNSDYSICRAPGVSTGDNPKITGCRLSDGTRAPSVREEYCEARIRAGICFKGFQR